SAIDIPVTVGAPKNSKIDLPVDTVGVPPAPPVTAAPQFPLTAKLIYPSGPSLAQRASGLT
ncbi:MAG: hypothetical protein GX683_01630, partial [Ruminococcaceae bacterium]|nr:hypothetical protein [Oscillospiraceae bacterium]